MLANKLIKKKPDPLNAKKHYQSFIRKKNIRSEIITYQPTTFGNPTLLIQNQFFQNIQKLHINYPRLQDYKHVC